MILARLRILAAFIKLFGREFFKASWKMILIIYFRPQQMRSKIFAVDLSPVLLWQQVVIAHFITLTPGTLTIEFLSDRRLLVHALDAGDEIGLKKLIATQLEPILLRWSNLSTEARPS